MKSRRFSGVKPIRLGTIPASQTRPHKPANPLGPQFHLPRSQRVSPDGTDVVEAVSVLPRRVKPPLWTVYSYADFDKNWTKAKIVETAGEIGLTIPKSWSKEKMIRALMDEGRKQWPRTEDEKPKRAARGLRPRGSRRLSRTS